MGPCLQKKITIICYSVGLPVVSICLIITTLSFLYLVTTHWLNPLGKEGKVREIKLRRQSIANRSTNVVHRAGSK